MKSKLVRIIAAALAVAAIAVGAAAHNEAPAGPPLADTSWT